FSEHSNERKRSYNKGLCQMHLRRDFKSKPKANPISEKPKMNLNSYYTRDYEKNDDFGLQKQTQSKPNSNPIQTQFKPISNPIQTHFCKIPD
ncbi:unnamed protein product, partial [marine sediment metagenome]